MAAAHPPPFNPPVEPVVVQQGTTQKVSSLFNETIPLLRSAVFYNSIYKELPLNIPAIEKSAPLRAIRITPENYNTILIPYKTHVIVPFSNMWVRAADIEKYGGQYHQLKMLFIGAQPFQSAPHETQLTFRLVPNECSALDTRFVACRVSGLNTYAYQIYYQCTLAETTRLSRRLALFHWRHTITERTSRAIDDAVAEGIATDEQTQILRERIKELVATTFRKP